MKDGQSGSPIFKVDKTIKFIKDTKLGIYKEM